MIKNTLGENIKQLRKERELSQQKLADISGVDKSSVYDYEKGRVKRPSESVVKKLAKALAVSPLQLLGTTPLTHEICTDCNTASALAERDYRAISKTVECLQVDLDAEKKYNRQIESDLVRMRGELHDARVDANRWIVLSILSVIALVILWFVR